MSRGPVSVIRVEARDTHDLRRRVLRDGTPSTEVVFDGDDEPTTVHLGAIEAGAIVGIATLIQRADPERPEIADVAYQLRGMATEPTHRGTGVGTSLLTAAIEAAGSLGAREVWARARLTALDFYLHNGFEAYGPEMLDAATGLMHRNIRRRLVEPDHE